VTIDAHCHSIAPAHVDLPPAERDAVCEDHARRLPGVDRRNAKDAKR